MELISIIIPVYNIKDYICECVDSLIVQTYRNLEIILVDDGSEDGSSQVCDALAEKDHRVHVIHQKNGGVSSARNTGIAHAGGQYITFVDGDDWVEKNFIEVLYDSIRKYHADVSVVGYTFRYPDRPAHRNPITGQVQTITGLEALEQACDPNNPWVGYSWGKLIHKDIIEKNNLEFDTEIKICEDSLFFYSLFEHVQRVVKNPDILYNYRIRQASVTQTANKSLNLLKNRIIALEKAMKIAGKYPDSIFLCGVKTALFSSIISYVAAMFRLKHYDKAELLQIKKRLSELTSQQQNLPLSTGIKVRACIFAVSPRLLYCFERLLSVIRR